MIPVNEPLVGDSELAYVTDAVRTGWISSEGRYIKDFEALFAAKCGRRHAVAVNNGTSALILAVRALNLPAGSEVIVPSFTIISCALACIYNDLVPVFVDSDPRTWNIDAARIEEKITARTRAIMPVHIYGFPVDMDAVEQIAARRGLIIVEDFAEAIGSSYRGKICGSFGLMSCASFYANKVITTGEGGMVLTDDDEMANRLRTLRNLAFLPDRRFVHEEAGFNFRMTNIQAALGLAQTERLTEHVRRKIAMGELYNRLLDPAAQKGLVQLPPRAESAVNTYWMYGVQLKDSVRLDAKAAMAELAAGGIGTRPFFYPMHQQPVFKKYPWFKEESMPVSQAMYERGFYLPSGLTLTEAAITESAEKLIALLSKHS